MTANTPPVARFASVSHRFGPTLALNDVSSAIPAGCMTGLIGPDGVGKSTLLGLVAGVRKLQTGRMTVLGGDMTDPAFRRSTCSRIAYVPQGLGRSLYPTLSIAENVDFAARLFGQSQAERRWRSDHLLHATGLAPFRHRRANQLSGGMKQKLAVCCALVHDPDFLILDEPTTGVDPLSRRQFWELIDSIRRQRPGMSVITASAYMEEVTDFDWLIAMDAGRILAQGAPADLIRRSGADNLEDAFIALLPPERRRDHQRVEAPPLPERQGAPAIEAENLTRRFGDFVAVDNVSVRVEKGEIFGFLGSNGCGKTTTMKMLTGLLQPTSGSVRLFGKAPGADRADMLQRVGYMSQLFSLYAELSVRQNLDMHARIFQIPRDRIDARVGEMLDRFDLREVADMAPASLPLGVRQRLQLATAVIHSPEMLILDEPTSGVDPIARDRFWELLVQLSRRDGVTIFISTHYVNEADRCDRVSLMHSGLILAMDTPGALRKARGAATLEAAFIGYLEDAARAEAEARGDTEPDAPPGHGSQEEQGRPGQIVGSRPGRMATLLDPPRLWAFARREAAELARDPIRLAFALLGPLILAVAMVYGISFDIEHVNFAAFDSDQTTESKMLLDEFVGSPYFNQRDPIQEFGEIDKRIQRGEIDFAVIIPAGYGRDLTAGRQPEVAFWQDSADPFRAETVRSYVNGAIARHVGRLIVTDSVMAFDPSVIGVETRFRYNQAFVSKNAISPGVLMLLIIMFSAMLTSLSVVREKEHGSIFNFYSAPAGKTEFLVGKQLPYIAVAMVSFVSLTLLICVGLGVPMKGSFFALTIGVALAAAAATGLGVVVSTLVRSQSAAIFGSAIIVMVPTVNFSGMIYPASTLTGSGKIIGALFPAYYFQNISSGVFNKGLGLAELYANHLTLCVFCVVFWAMAVLLLRKQEA